MLRPVAKDTKTMLFSLHCWLLIAKAVSPLASSFSMCLSSNASPQFHCTSLAFQLSTSNCWGHTLGACSHGPCDLRVCACCYAGAKRHGKKEGAAPQSDLQDLPNFFACRSCALLPSAFYFSCSCYSPNCTVFLYSCNRSSSIPIFLFSGSYSQKLADTIIDCPIWRCTATLVLFCRHCFLLCPCCCCW